MRTQCIVGRMETFTEPCGDITLQKKLISLTRTKLMTRQKQQVNSALRANVFLSTHMTLQGFYNAYGLYAHRICQNWAFHCFSQPNLWGNLETSNILDRQVCEKPNNPMCILPIDNTHTCHSD